MFHVKPPKFNIAPENSWFSRLVSFWDCPFSRVDVEFPGCNSQGARRLSLMFLKKNGCYQVTQLTSIVRRSFGRIAPEQLAELVRCFRFIRCVPSGNPNPDISHPKAVGKMSFRLFTGGICDCSLEGMCYCFFFLQNFLKYCGVNNVGMSFMVGPGKMYSVYCSKGKIVYILRAFTVLFTKELGSGNLTNKWESCIVLPLWYMSVCLLLKHRKTTVDSSASYLRGEDLNGKWFPDSKLQSSMSNGDRLSIFSLKTWRSMPLLNHHS